jgi:ribonuclease HI
MTNYLYTDASLISLTRLGGLGVVVLRESEIFRGGISSSTDVGKRSTSSEEDDFYEIKSQSIPYKGKDGCIVRAELEAIKEGLSLCQESAVVVRSDSLTSLQLLFHLGILSSQDPLVRRRETRKETKFLRKLQDAQERYNDVLSQIREILSKMEAATESQWVKGHSSDKWNHRADYLAGAAATAWKRAS